MIFHPQRSLADWTDRWSAGSGQTASNSHAELMKGHRHSVSGGAGASAPGVRSWPVEIGTLVAAGVFAWYFVYLRYLFNSEFPLATPQALAEGTAYIPFQFRALVPWIAGAIQSMGIADLATAYKALDWASLVGVYYAFRYLLAPLMARGTAALLSFAVFFILPWNYILPRGIPILLPYDLPAVMFFTLGLALLRRRNWGWYRVRSRLHEPRDDGVLGRRIDRDGFWRTVSPVAAAARGTARRHLGNGQSPDVCVVWG